MIHVRTLGVAQIDVGASQVTPASSRRFAILLYLALEAGRRVSRAALHNLVYPDQSEKNARHSLREAIYQLRRLGVPIDATADGVSLAVEQVCVDHLVICDEGSLTPEMIVAIEGGLLPSYEPVRSEAYVEWLEAYRAAAIRRLTRALLDAAARAKASGAWQWCARVARALPNVGVLRLLGHRTLVIAA